MARKTTKKPATKTSRRSAKPGAAPTTKKAAAGPNGFSPLARAMLWVDRPGSAEKIFYALAGLCGFLFLLDFTYEKHGHFDMEHLPGFYGIYGFVMFTALILAAKTLRIFIRRPEDYYGDKAIDSEAYPADQLDKRDHNA